MAQFNRGKKIGPGDSDIWVGEDMKVPAGGSHLILRLEIKRI